MGDMNQKLVDGLSGDAEIAGSAEMRSELVVATEGGNRGTPVWSRDGREIFHAGDGGIFSAETSYEGAFEAAEPVRLFTLTRRTFSGYDVDSSGERLLMVLPVGQDSTADQTEQLHIVLNWFDELRSRVPTGR